MLPSYLSISNAATCHKDSVAEVAGNVVAVVVAVYFVHDARVHWG